MHNLHLAVIAANYHEQAVDTVESSIAGWGHDDNWYLVFGALRLKDNKLVITNENSGFVDWVQQEFYAHQCIEAAINRWINDVPYRNITRQFKVDESRLSASDYYCLERYAKHMYEASAFKKKLYTMEGMQGFFEHQYDVGGITYLGDDHHHWDKNYVVFIDMHS